MNERERFEEWLNDTLYYADYPENITDQERSDSWAGFEARAEIAKQDEKELIEALKYYANNQHVKRNIRQGKEFIEVENGEIAKKALEKLNG